MKYFAITLTGVLIIVIPYSIYQRNQISDLKADLSHLKNTIDIRVSKEINDAKRYVTDSLLKEFNEREPITETKIKIKYRYDTIIDSVLVMPSDEQLRYITNELNRLYPDN